jgi:hypothetical protein
LQSFRELLLDQLLLACSFLAWTALTGLDISVVDLIEEASYLGSERPTVKKEITNNKHLKTNRIHGLG